jgi:hypothetical protein
LTADRLQPIGCPASHGNGHEGRAAPIEGVAGLSQTHDLGQQEGLSTSAERHRGGIYLPSAGHERLGRCSPASDACEEPPVDNEGAAQRDDRRGRYYVSALTMQVLRLPLPGTDRSRCFECRARSTLNSTARVAAMRHVGAHAVGRRTGASIGACGLRPSPTAVRRRPRRAGVQ